MLLAILEHQDAVVQYLDYESSLQQYSSHGSTY